VRAVCACCYSNGMGSSKSSSGRSLLAVMTRECASALKATLSLAIMYRSCMFLIRGLPKRGVFIYKGLCADNCILQ
jgi:hypothetical protein